MRPGTPLGGEASGELDDAERVSQSWETSSGVGAGSPERRAGTWGCGSRAWRQGDGLAGTPSSELEQASKG